MREATLVERSHELRMAARGIDAARAPDGHERTTEETDIGGDETETPSGAPANGTFPPAPTARARKFSHQGRAAAVLAPVEGFVGSGHAVVGSVSFR
ncbi:MAG TPA: hypothetical protein VLK65_03580 [Vicinamibacteria bacterium]|nr:hypothetical protein [Vicinamibacteria bacterium]